MEKRIHQPIQTEQLSIEISQGEEIKKKKKNKRQTHKSLESRPRLKINQDVIYSRITPSKHAELWKLTNITFNQLFVYIGMAADINNSAI